MLTHWISNSPRAALLAAILLALCATEAVAADSGGTNTPTCDRGQVWSQSANKCVKASSELDDSDLIQGGQALARAGRYDEALGVLEMVKKPDAVALTYVGYSLRKSGKAEEGIAQYHEALKLDPANADTREYLGEGYVATGRIDLAKAELAKVEALCGRECEPYEELAEAIAAAN